MLTLSVMSSWEVEFDEVLVLVLVVSGRSKFFGEFANAFVGKGKSVSQLFTFDKLSLKQCLGKEVSRSYLSMEYTLTVLLKFTKEVKMGVLIAPI